MADKAALIIGVSSARPLVELPGAVHGALKFETWAKKQGYKTELLVDIIAGKIEPVTAKLVADAVDRLLKSPPERLLIYFSGHGVQPTYSNMYWLLSGWHDDSNEAINVTLSVANAKRCGFSQVAVFSDACRSFVEDAQYIGGQAIFPKKPFSSKQPQWDSFFASRMGEPAQEVNASKKAEEAFGLFSACVMDALTGKKTEAFKPGNNFTLKLTSGMLAKYIESDLPLRSGATSGAQVQLPEVIPGWLDPDDVYVEILASVGLGPKKTFSKDLLDPVTASPPSASATKNISEDTVIAARVAAMRKEDADGVARRTEANLERQGRLSFETHIGLSIIGEGIKAAVASKNEKIEIIFEKDVTHVRGYGDRSLDIAIKLKSGHWAACTMFPGFVGTLGVEAGAVASVSYAPAGRRNEDRFKQLFARWNALSHHGIQPDQEELENFAGDARYLKHENQALGVMAAYAYERISNLKALRSLPWYYARRKEFVPFDVAYISGWPIAKKNKDLVITTKIKSETAMGRIAGRFPLMTQGWAYLDPDDKFLNGDLFEIRRGLVASMWTTLRPNEGKQLAELIREELL